jgi:conjugative relaxase-like TrwC/TraI family protein
VALFKRTRFAECWKVDTRRLLRCSSARGSAGRADPSRTKVAVSPIGDPGEILSTEQVGALLGVSERYVRKVAAEANDLTESQSAQLRGVRADGRNWVFRRDDVERFATTRNEKKVVVAYDVTVSFEKSISLVWARASTNERQVIEAALDAGTNAAVAYLEDQAVAVRRGRCTEKADGVWAASYRHLTNRNLEPQLHDHVVIANIGAADGRTQALDSRLLHHHAKTAGHVAGAVTRRHLSERLGIAWQPVERGLSDIDGITRNQIATFSTRRAELTTLTNELGLDSPQARAIAARATRATKQEPADWDTLEAEWQSQLDTVGLTSDRWDQLQHRQQPTTITAKAANSAVAWLDSPVGVTKSNGVFSRKDVVQAIVEWDGQHGHGTRLTFDDIDRITDTYLASGNVVGVDMTASQITRTGEPHWYTTTTVLDMERAVIRAYTYATHPAPPAETSMVAAAITHWETESGHTLGADQQVMVAAITTGGNQFQAVVGPAGSGKTATLEIAARIWEQTGNKPLGASVTGTATEVLEEATGIQTRTVASLLAELNIGGQPFTESTVLIVDEASTLSNRDHHALMQAIQTVGARMVTIGDPAQHRAVEAGGLWAHLVETLGDRVPELTDNRRQTGELMSDVRLANAEYRNHHITAAIQRLDTNQRIITAPTATELLDALTADWYIDHQATMTDGAKPSRMMAESHTVRRQLNQRAQTLLTADGTLTGTPVTVGSEQFHVGDHVITRTQDRNLRYPDGHFVRNGATGTITAIDTDPEGHHQMTVNFDRHGTIVLHHEFLTQHIRAGVDGGLAPAYAITTHAAQGSTYQAGRMMTTDTSSREGVYVALTRGTSDARLYLVRADTLNPTDRSDTGLPIVHDTRTALKALTDHLQAPDPAMVIAATDPNARTVQLLRTHTIDQLRLEAVDDPNARRALQHTATATARATIHQPTEAIIERFGDRPDPTSPMRTPWDNVVIRLVEHHVVHGTTNDLIGEGRDHARLAAAIERLDHLQAASSVVPVRDLAAQIRAVETRSPIDEHQLRDLTDQLDRHIERAVSNPADYLTDLLGPRPTEDHETDLSPQRWDTAATTIETHRHHAGITPFDGPLNGDTPYEKAVGTLTDPIEALTIERAIDAHLDTPSKSISVRN